MINFFSSVEECCSMVPNGGFLTVTSFSCFPCAMDVTGKLNDVKCLQLVRSVGSQRRYKNCRPLEDKCGTGL